ncbi:MAG: GIY-YIG nuclease family protein [Bacteroidota bacterium]
MYTVYVLTSLKDGKHYTGYTSDIKRRLKEHNAGKTASTKRRRPFKLIYSEEYNSELEAKEREKILKSGKGREELKEILINLKSK